MKPTLEYGFDYKAIHWDPAMDGDEAEPTPEPAKTT